MNRQPDFHMDEYYRNMVIRGELSKIKKTIVKNAEDLVREKRGGDLPLLLQSK